MALNYTELLRRKPVIPLQGVQQMSEDEIEDSDESDTLVSDEPIYNRQFCTTAGREWNDITFLNNRWKKNYPGNTVRGYKPPTCSRRKVNKWVKYRMIHRFHEWCAEKENRGEHANVVDFIDDHVKYRGGSKSKIQSTAYRTWTEWAGSRWTSDSWRFLRLKRFVDKVGRKVAQKTFRFYGDPMETSCGMCPVVETFLVEYRAIRATEYQWRSVNWLTVTGKRTLANVTLMNLLRPLMGRGEWGRTACLKCSTNYIWRIVVCLIWVSIRYRFAHSAK